jgi:hypothetical protein
MERSGEAVGGATTRGKVRGGGGLRGGRCEGVGLRRWRGRESARGRRLAKREAIYLAGRYKELFGIMAVASISRRTSSLKR